MIQNKITLKIVIALVCLFSLSVACAQNEPESISQVTPVPNGNGIEIISIDEGQITTSEISQQKIFDQCASSSPLKAEIRFSQLSGQESQSDLVFKGNIGGEIGLSEIAKVEVGSAIERRFTNTSTSGQTHDEGIVIEVPAYTKQEYSIVWQEIRRDGKVEYIEDGDPTTVDYSYRIGVELSSSTVVDLVCPEQESLETTENTAPVSDPTNTPQPTPTSQPTPTPQPPTITNTPPDSILAVGEKWHAEGRELMLNNYKFESTRIRFEIRFTNGTGNTIIFDISTESFVVTDNLGRRYTASYPFGCGTGGASDLTLTLESGETKDCNVYFNSSRVDYSNPQVDKLIFSMTASVFQNASWQIPIQH